MRDETTLLRWLRRWVADAVGTDPTEVAPDRPLEEFGLSSREAVALSGELEDLLGVALPTTLVWDHPTIAMLAAHLASREPGDEQPASLPRPEIDRAGGPAGAREPVAVVGMGCRLPGGADSPDRFWRLLADGTDAVTPEPDGRWQTPTGAHGGYLDDVAGFDAEFFGIAPREATAMDPQQRMLLEVCWEALENAGVAPDRLRGSATGVFVGVSSYDYGLRTSADPGAVNPWTLTGVATSITANRLSYLLDLRGPSLALDTACSSSLVAVHQACRSLRWGDCDAAVAAGANLLLHPAPLTAFADAGALAADGRCKAFDADADGIGRGEGVGVVVLKRLSDARRDGDPVLALLTGSAVNSDGRSNGLTAPNPGAQADLLRAAYADAEREPASVDYVEAHGTGTLLGDPIEAGALGSVLSRERPAGQPLLLGSVKSNLGHLEGAAGIAGLIKVVLAMRHDALPASLHYHTPNPHISFDEHGLRVITEPSAWPRGTGRATAGVSAFGFGGTNAHLVVEEPDPDPARAVTGRDPDEPPAVLLVSAPSERRLREAAQDLAEWLESPEGQRHELTAVGYGLARRTAHRSRAGVVCRDRAAALDGLRALAAGQAAPGVVSGTVSGEVTDPVWVFSGYGSQWPGMAREMLAEQPAFAAAIDELEPLVAAEAGFSVTEVLADGQRVAAVDRAQVAIFAVQVGLAATWRAHGVRPAAVIGHSMGEVAAAVTAGALDLADAVRVICVRSRLLAEQEAAGGGAMAVVGLSAAELDALPERFGDVSVAVHSAPQTLTVAGPGAQVRDLVAHVDGLGRTARLLDVSGAGHTSAVDPILGELAAELAGIGDCPAQVPMYSTVLDDPRASTHHEGGYWVAGVRRPVRFSQAVAAAVADGHRTFVELAPHPIAAPAVAATAAASGLPDPLLAVSLRRDTDSGHTFRAALAELHAHGVAVDTASLHPHRPLPGLPNTRWHHTRYWTELTTPSASDPGAGPEALPGVHVELPDGRHAWQITGTAQPRALLEAAAARVLGAAELSDVRLAAPAPPGRVQLTTTLTPPTDGTNGGTAVLQVHARQAQGWQLVAEAAAAPAATGVATGSLGARLRDIVARVMGFAAESIDPDVPLVELGLDSLMAVRAKNIIEYELGTPPLVLGMLRGAGLADLEQHVTALLDGAAPAAALLDGAAPAAALLDGAAPAAALPGDVAAPAVGPRDATERLVVREWPGEPAPGVTDEITDADAVAQLAARLGDRLQRTVEASELLSRQTVAGMADLLRDEVDGSDGQVRRVLAEPTDPGESPLFLFHPAGGPCSVYQPLVERLGGHVPCYGLERVEGELADRVEQYLPLLREIGGDGPYRLAGWSFGGALAFETARRLAAEGAGVDLLALIDTVRPPADDVDEPQASLDRWQRFARYIERTYATPLALPMSELAEADEQRQLDIVTERMRRAGLAMSPRVLAHQRTSWIDSRAAERHVPGSWDGPVVLYRARAMHEQALELDPRYARAGEDAGWASLCPRLEIVPVDGDHLGVIDPPTVSTVAADLSDRLRARVRSAR